MREEYRPTDAALIADLGFQWQDHWDGRTQMWRTIQVSAALVVALVGASQFGSEWLSIAVGFFLMLSAAIGIVITKHLRKCQETKFRVILRLEEELGLFESVYWHGEADSVETTRKQNVYGRVGVQPPGEGTGRRTKLHTPNLIVCLHLIIALFAAVYVSAVWMGAAQG